MTVSSGPATIGEKELIRDWPNEEGLILGTTKRDSDPASLEPEEADLTAVSGNFK